eukprot:CAMPEP_0206824568 /NCGR_PEP_ID=MMETSP0975-20121206/13899_1 /ASSEMBLY_ACC=CAM_ASM_000399 /TAXON_ID=483370 /ORGANISM="non described non described, Strain CCMP2097" /LENGTH=375 /DNA_ID=CAMNT_0054366843 /DNA_START=1 /DNA_END=1128 /DNA_ORIENTATION=-
MRCSTARLLAFLALNGAYALVPAHTNQGGHRRITAHGQYDGLKKPELVAQCKLLGLRTAGTKAELVVRLDVEAAAQSPYSAMTYEREPVVSSGQAENAEAAQPADAAYPAMSAPAAQDSFFETSQRFENPEALQDAAIDLLLTEVRDTAPELLDAELLVAKTEVLLANGGMQFEATAKRRLLRSSGDSKLAGAISLVRGFVKTTQRARARERLQLILRAATLGGRELDECLRGMASSKELDEPLRQFVDDLIAKAARQQASAATDAQKSESANKLLPRVLEIVRDRIAAERHVSNSNELRTLAAALQLQGPALDDFLESALSTSIEFSQQFESYVDDAANFINSQNANTEDDRARKMQMVMVQRSVQNIRKRMPV